MTRAGSALLAWLTGGSALAVLAKVLLAVCGLVFGLVYRRYVGILGADRRKPAERQAYNALRNSLAEGNVAARLYAERLTRFLDWIDRFFGDAGMASRTLFPRAFGLRTPAPLWTASAFDRCLLLAFMYPIVTIFAIWAVSGHVGPAEAALGLKSDLSGWKRGLAGVAIGFAILATWRAIEEKGLKRYAWGIPGYVVACAAGFSVAGAVGGVVAGALALSMNGAVISISALASDGTGLVACATVGILSYGLIGFGSGVREARFTVAVTIAVILGVSTGGMFAIYYGIVRLNKLASRHQLQGGFLSLFLPVMIMIDLGAAHFLAPLETWGGAGPLLVFLGLLTLFNAPFDWASLGLTRALLRRGLEQGGWWPYGLALLDAGLAALIIAALTLTMVIGVQAFDALAVNGGGKPVLPLDVLFNGIAAHPAAPEYWWLYALLLSSMIPSLVNLVIGGSSLSRGLPCLPSLLLRKIPPQGNVPKFDRAWIATVLTAQVAAGAALGIAAQAFLVVLIIGYIMPFFGLELLDMARDVATFNLPARVGHLFGVRL